jgi:hypothetical protein
VTTQVPGGPVNKRRIIIDSAEKKTVLLAVKLPSEPALPRQPDAAVPPAQGGGARRALAYVAGGVGVAGVATGAVAGMLALRQGREADSNCTDGDGGVALCNREGKDAGDRAKMLGVVSTAAFGVGVAGLGVATLLFLTAPSSQGGAAHRTEARDVGFWLDAGPGGAATGYRGRW